MCLHELSIVDDTLEALGVSKEYQQLRNWIIRIIFGWIVFISITEVVEEIINYTVYKVSVLNICVKFVFNIPKYVNLLNDLWSYYQVGIHVHTYIYFVKRMANNNALLLLLYISIITMTLQFFYDYNNN